MRNLLAVGASVALSACAGAFLGNDPSPERLTKAALGVWVVDRIDSAQAMPVAAGVRPYRSPYYWVRQRPNEGLIIQFDNGLTCSESVATVRRNQLHAMVLDPVVIEVRSSGRATATFEDGTALTLKKTRELGKMCEG